MQFGWSMDHVQKFYGTCPNIWVVYGPWCKSIGKSILDGPFPTHTHTHSPLLGTKEIWFMKHFAFFAAGKKHFGWTISHTESPSLLSQRDSRFGGLVSSCGAGAVSRTHHTTAFLGGGACLPAKRNRKTSPVFSLSLSIGGMKEIRLMMPFVFFAVGKKAF